MWPPQSPDLNPLDYNIWSVLKEEVQGSSHPNLESQGAHRGDLRGCFSKKYYVLREILRFEVFGLVTSFGLRI